MAQSFVQGSLKQAVFLSTVRGMDLSLTQPRAINVVCISLAVEEYFTIVHAFDAEKSVVIPDNIVCPFNWSWTLSRQFVKNSMCSVYFIKEQEFLR